MENKYSVYFWNEFKQSEYVAASNSNLHFFHEPENGKKYYLFWVLRSNISFMKTKISLKSWFVRNYDILPIEISEWESI